MKSQIISSLSHSIKRVILAQQKWLEKSPGPLWSILQIKKTICMKITQITATICTIKKWTLTNIGSSSLMQQLQQLRHATPKRSLPKSWLEERTSCSHLTTFKIMKKLKVRVQLRKTLLQSWSSHPVVSCLKAIKITGEIVIHAIPRLSLQRIIYQINNNCKILKSSSSSQQFNNKLKRLLIFFQQL